MCVPYISNVLQTALRHAEIITKTVSRLEAERISTGTVASKATKHSWLE